MRSQKPKAQPQKLTSEFAADLQAKWTERGKEILDKLCDEAPTKLVETLGKLAVAERLSPPETVDFNEANTESLKS